MWMTIASGLLVIALTAADDAATVAPEAAHEANVPLPAMPDFGGQTPTAEQLLEIIESMTSITDEEKAILKEDLLKNMQEGGGDFLQQSAGNDLTMQTMVLLSLLGLVALIFVFFVYKLFKVLSERKAKREEKKKNKQMKKKK
ncbi:unnamed protein product [Xylocopa violacea]|uniref:Uncharacterized protein n=1 Tax=Xylocopa violacea TaxID=135666 RepID=A0ABP1PBT0_XYLVO